MMPTTLTKLDRLVTRVRSLPESRLLAAVDALAEIAEEYYQLSEDEPAVPPPALDVSDRGEFVADDQAAELRANAWR